MKVYELDGKLYSDRELMVGYGFDQDEIAKMKPVDEATAYEYLINTGGVKKLLDEDDIVRELIDLRVTCHRQGFDFYELERKSYTKYLEAVGK